MSRADDEGESGKRFAMPFDARCIV